MEETEQQMMTIQEFIAKHNITMQAERIKRRSDVAMQSPEQVAWRCTFTKGDETMTTEFGHGTGWRPLRELTRTERQVMRSPFGSPGDQYHGEREHLEELATRGKLNEWGKARLTQFNYPKPHAEDILPSLRMDAQTYTDMRDALDLAEAFGMGAQRARRMWRALEHGFDKLTELLGPMAVTELITKVEEE